MAPKAAKPQYFTDADTLPPRGHVFVAEELVQVAVAGDGGLHGCAPVVGDALLVGTGDRRGQSCEWGPEPASLDGLDDVLAGG